MILSAWAKAETDNQHDKLAKTLPHSHFSLHNDMTKLQTHFHTHTILCIST